MSNDTRCWDASADDNSDELIELEQVRCISDRSTFLNHRVNLGQFAYSYSLLKSTKPISKNHFYGIYSTVYKVGEINRSTKDYGDYSCNSSFIKIADKAFKTTLCRQPLKDYKSPEGQSIDDVHFLAAGISEENQGFLIQIEIIGVQKNLANAVITKILEQIKWQK